MIGRYVADLGRHADPYQVALPARPAGKDVGHSWPLIATGGLKGETKIGAPPVLGERHPSQLKITRTELASLVWPPTTSQVHPLTGP